MLCGGSLTLVELCSFNKHSVIASPRYRHCVLVDGGGCLPACVPLLKRSSCVNALKATTSSSFRIKTVKIMPTQMKHFI